MLEEVEKAIVEEESGGGKAEAETPVSQPTVTRRSTVPAPLAPEPRVVGAVTNRPIPRMPSIYRPGSDAPPVALPSVPNPVVIQETTKPEAVPSEESAAPVRVGRVTRASRVPPAPARPAMPGAPVEGAPRVPGGTGR